VLHSVGMMMSQTQLKVGTATAADSRLTGASLVNKRPVAGRLVEISLAVGRPCDDFESRVYHRLVLQYQAGLAL
jgi:hypothetical protein